MVHDFLNKQMGKKLMKNRNISLKKSLTQDYHHQFGKIDKTGKGFVTTNEILEYLKVS